MGCSMDDAGVEQALKDWAHWVMSGRTADGFPRCNVLDKSWLPPTPGSTPTMKVSRFRDARERDTHQAIGRLSLKLANTVVVHYCYRLSVIDQCERLGCATSTLHQRLAVARDRVRAELSVIRRSSRN